MATNSSANKALADPQVKDQSEKANQSEPQSFRYRLIWFVGLWLGGVFALGVVGYAIRAWLGLS
ncbi:hypothetical protein [Kiloniella majae]|uniref:hypothetical protein n=1 Tax=Kiloniella majae TaxID=1938558 RepID=UPI000A2779E3|nr:hypothetical protein [Kiloniella majae]